MLLGKRLGDIKGPFEMPRRAAQDVSSTVEIYQHLVCLLASQPMCLTAIAQDYTVRLESLFFGQVKVDRLCGGFQVLCLRQREDRKLFSIL